MKKSVHRQEYEDLSTPSPRLMELRLKVHDGEYLNYAVQRIAQVVSKRLVESKTAFSPESTGSVLKDIKNEKSS